MILLKKLAGGSLQRDGQAPGLSRCPSRTREPPRLMRGKTAHFLEAVRLGRVKDTMIIMAFAYMNRCAAQMRCPRIILVDKRNRIHKGKDKHADI